MNIFWHCRQTHLVYVLAAVWIKKELVDAKGQRRKFEQIGRVCIQCFHKNEALNLTTTTTTSNNNKYGIYISNTQGIKQVLQNAHQAKLKGWFLFI